MPRSAEANKRIKDERREQILAAARGVFARKGCVGTKIADVAVAAGMSHGLVYHYFDSKEAVYLALVEEAAEEASRLTGAALARKGTPWARLSWLCEQMMTQLARDPDDLLIVVQAFTSEAIPDEARARMLRAGIDSFSHVRTLIEQGQRARQVVAGDPTELAQLFLALIQGLTFNSFVGPKGTPPAPSAASVLRLLAADRRASPPRPKRSARLRSV